MAEPTGLESRAAVSWLLRTALWLLLGGWLGAWALFGFVVAPTAFQVLPSQDSAGTLVAPILAALHHYGIAAGVGLAALGWLLKRGSLVVALPALLALLCAVSEYGVTRSIEEVLPRSFGSAQQLEASRRFSELHQTSRFLFGSVGLGILGLIGLHVRLDSAGNPSAGDRGSPGTPKAGA